MELWWLFFRLEGRVRRLDYWLGVVVLTVPAVGAYFLDRATGNADADGFGPFSAVVTAVTSWSWIALHAKRWHDRDKSGWWTLIGLVPFIGAVWMLIELGVLRGTDGANKYGPDPLSD
ncbi:MAG: DUF805 domain-containing protein [Aestuariivirga sp.]|uniref:DUF805 domain-containing protein n=1 Tax=Aestuariivirga sp. TaxID=2650926 RepID=UPI0025C3E38E|nr:DUF805 domain-containing protein [Aestuariivirga sp.]MCA3562661.1 DUF805 domain-containing protein [Aestuariivirga sp.]